MEKTTIGFLKTILIAKELDPCEKLILNAFMTSKNRNFWDMEKLAEMFGISRQLVSKKIKSLIEKGFIFRTKPKGKRYYLTYATEKAKKRFTANNDLKNDDIIKLFNKIVKGERESNVN